MLWAELRRIAKVGGKGDELGGPGHQELTVLSNEPLTKLGNEATLTVKNQPLYAANSGAVSSCCENDEAPTIDFLKQVALPDRQPSLSPVEDHVIGVKLLAAAYESAANCLPIPVKVEFDARDWNKPPST